MAAWNGSSNELNAGYCADGYARLNGLAVLVRWCTAHHPAAPCCVAAAHRMTPAPLPLAGDHVRCGRVVGHQRGCVVAAPARSSACA